MKVFRFKIVLHAPQMVIIILGKIKYYQEKIQPLVKRQCRIDFNSLETSMCSLILIILIFIDFNFLFIFISVMWFFVSFFWLLHYAVYPEFEGIKTFQISNIIIVGDQLLFRIDHHFIRRNILTTVGTLDPSWYYRMWIPGLFGSNKKSNQSKNRCYWMHSECG